MSILAKDCLKLKLKFSELYSQVILDQLNYEVSFFL